MASLTATPETTPKVEALPSRATDPSSSPAALQPAALVDPRATPSGVSPPLPTSPSRDPLAAPPPATLTHLLKIIQQQQERIAALQATVAGVAERAQHTDVALIDLSPRCGGQGIHHDGLTAAAPSPPSTTEVAITKELVSRDVRWSDAAAVEGSRSPTVSCERSTDEGYLTDKASRTVSSSPPPRFAPLPVILLDVTSLFSAHSPRDSSTKTTSVSVASQPSRASSSTQTEDLLLPQQTVLSAEANIKTAVMRERAVNEVFGEVAMREGTRVSAQLPQRHPSQDDPTPSCRPTAAHAPPADEAATLRISLDEACPSLQTHSAVEIASSGTAKELEELRRLRLLLRFSELKKDSDHLAEAQQALQESSAAQLRLRQRCDRLEHEKAQLSACIGVVASHVQSALISSSSCRANRGSFDGSTSSATKVDDAARALEFALHLCEDAAPLLNHGAAEQFSVRLTPSAAPKAPLPPAPPRPRQDRLHVAVHGNRVSSRPPSRGPLSRRSSWSMQDAAVMSKRQRRASAVGSPGWEALFS